MRTYSSPAFGRIDSPESIAELLNILYDLNAPNVFMWRGQSSADWPMHSAAYRRQLMDKRFPPNRSYLKSYEEYLLKKARHQGFDFIEGRRLSDLELLARLQHHGAATRLVDFTRSAFVALYFCCAQNPFSTGALIRNRPNYLGGHEGETEERPYDEIEAEIETMDYPATWQPTGVSLRITSQRSQFLYSRLSDDPRGSLQVDKAPDAFLAVGISPELKTLILSFLKSVCDIHQTSLFPDLDGFATAHGAGVSVYGNERW